jgi:hypothetical protein
MTHGRDTSSYSGNARNGVLRRAVQAVVRYAVTPVTGVAERGDRLPEPMLALLHRGARLGFRRSHSRCAPILPRSVQKNTCLTHTTVLTVRGLIYHEGVSAMKEAIGRRRERTRKEGKCQLCEMKVPVKDQYTVINDLDVGKPVKQKNAARKGAEKLSHYCDGCADRRVGQKQTWIDARARRIAKESV